LTSCCADGSEHLTLPDGSVCGKHSRNFGGTLRECVGGNIDTDPTVFNKYCFFGKKEVN
jgi:hypothetical protein